MPIVLLVHTNFESNIYIIVTKKKQKIVWNYLIFINVKFIEKYLEREHM